ncbi:unnamed protein product [Didymodactylos carnosus]|uniref:Uncharacterized protein n=1 Tax=Didymodactylos carnosus TaxID=1234261 RepID=A0A8S2UIN3_9BILA|nr:unnamed protein product [Didymodactylos carnosus]CAF4347082.1 unnamed protein product [Didymodactylos carnosus]
MGTLSLSTSKFWDELKKEGKATEWNKTVITAVFKNEGKLDSIQAYDDQTVSAGAMQKTIRKETGEGQLADQVYEFKRDYPELYKRDFEDRGWRVS